MGVGDGAAVGLCGSKVVCLEIAQEVKNGLRIEATSG
jgi:hypothetical protein